MSLLWMIFMIFLVIFLMNFIKKDSLGYLFMLLVLCGFIIILLVVYLVNFFLFTLSNILIICCWASSTVHTYNKL